VAQFGRPSTDTTREAYTDQAAGTTNIFQAIDEAVASDADYIQSAESPSSDVYVTKLACSPACEDPGVSTGHTVRYRYGKNTSGGGTIDQTVQLRQGYVDEGTPGTLIAEAVHNNVGVAPIAGSIALSGAEADAITDYTDLYIRIVSNQSA
jgi:hypothetical protein